MGGSSAKKAVARSSSGSRAITLSTAMVSIGSQPVATRLTRLATASISLSSRSASRSSSAPASVSRGLAGAAVEQQHVERVLDLAHPVAQRAGHQVEGAGGGGKAAGAGHGLEHGEGVGGQHVTGAGHGGSIDSNYLNGAIKLRRLSECGADLKFFTSAAHPARHTKKAAHPTGQGRRSSTMLQVRKSQERGYADHGWLQLLPQLFFRRLLRPGAHGLRQPAGDQRRPRGRGRRLRHPRPQGHGDHQLRALGRAGAQGQHGQRGAHSARRRAAHERGPRRDAQRVQPQGRRDHALPADLDRAQRARHRARATSRRSSATPRSAASCAWWPRPTAPTAR